MNISELQTEAHACAVEKGWHESDELDEDDKPTARQKLAWLALVTDELDEAEEANDPASDIEDVLEFYEGEKPCGIISEYADARIRIMDWAGACGWSLELPRPECDYMDAVKVARTHLVYWIRRGDEGQQIEWLARLFLAIKNELVDDYDCAERLQRVTEEKMAYNRTRQHRHGGKLA